MSTKKTQPKAKTTEPKPKYSIGSKVFIIERERSQLGRILQAKVESVKTIKGLRGQMSAEPHSVAKLVHHTAFEYDLTTELGEFNELGEWALFPTLISASLEFTSRFTCMLK